MGIVRPASCIIHQMQQMHLMQQMQQMQQMQRTVTGGWY
jgi:hypothetical protein